MKHGIGNFSPVAVLGTFIGDSVGTVWGGLGVVPEQLYFGGDGRDFLDSFGADMGTVLNIHKI